MKTSTTAKIIVALAIVVLSFSACAGADTEESLVWDGDISFFYGQTLTIAIPNDNRHIKAIHNAAWAYMNMTGATIEIVQAPEDVEAAQAQIAMQLMTGTAPTLMSAFLFDYANPMLFADWRPLFDLHPDFCYDDWNMNAFDALTVDGQLLNFTTCFAYFYVLANSEIYDLALVLAERDSITLTELLELYSKFNNNPTVAGDSLFLAPQFDLYFALTHFYMHHFLDIETGMVNFNSREFIDFINTVQVVVNTESSFADTPLWWWPVGCRSTEALLSNTYMFRFKPVLPIENLGIFDEDTIFVNPTLLVCANGNLLIDDSLRTGWGLNAGATFVEQVMALDFLLFLADVGGRHSGWAVTGVWHPTNKSVLHYEAVYILDSIIMRFYVMRSLWRLREGISATDAAEELLERKIEVGEMPMLRAFYAPSQIRELIRESLYSFHRGFVSAEQTAQDLQNRVTLVLLEIE